MAIAESDCYRASQSRHRLPGPEPPAERKDRSRNPDVKLANRPGRHRHGAYSQMVFWTRVTILCSPELPDRRRTVTGEVRPTSHTTPARRSLAARVRRPPIHSHAVP